MMRALFGKLFLAVRGAMIVTCCSAATAAVAADCSVPLDYRTITSGSALCLTSGSYGNDDEIFEAAARWNDACGMDGTKPELKVGGCGTGDAVVTVDRIAGVSDNPRGTCGYYQANGNGANTGGVIGIFEYGKDPFTHQVYPCATYYAIDTLMHEIGHALGLADVADNSCVGRVMGPPSGTYSPTIASDDCQAVDDLWRTADEQTGGGGVCCEQDRDDNPNNETNWPPGSPIIIDVRGDGYDLTSLEAGVGFDLVPGGAVERTAWTNVNTDDAFLVLDRDGDGLITNGTELFGDHSAQPRSVAPNGFIALAMFDRSEAGGNGDGVITSSDAAFTRLMLWTDRNHNGVSEPHELATLAQSGIETLGLIHRMARRQDRHGNVFRYRAPVTFAVRPDSPRWAYDVFFVFE